VTTAAPTDLARGLALAEADPWRFTIQYPPSRDYFREDFRGAPDTAALIGAPRLLVYLHVPFCEARCLYCNFPIDTRRDLALKKRTVDALVREVESLTARLPPTTEIPGIDIGGGTPTALPVDELVRLVAALSPLLARSRARIPLSIETTPRIAATEPDKLAALAASGVGRVSIGVQTSDPQALAKLNRGAQGSLEERAFRSITDAGFERVNVDLIFGLPGQTLDSWREDLRKADGLGPDAITTYDCLYRGAGRGLGRLSGRPSPELLGEFYDEAFSFLTARGWRAPYGALTFSRRAGETGTSSYFEGRLLDGLPYAGLGCGASSLAGDSWWFAPARLDAWLAAVDGGESIPVEDSYRLPLGDRAAKYALASLSFGFLDPSRFETSLGAPLPVVFGDALAAAADRGWFRETNDRWSIAAGRFGSMPALRALFYPETALAWLEERRESL